MVVASTLGIAVAAALWWVYFDVTVWVAERRLSRATPGREQNEVARDAYSYLHLPMVAGIVLLALGMKKTLEHANDPLETVPAAALVGGVAMYLLAIVAFRWRLLHTLGRPRLIAAAALLGLLPAGASRSLPTRPSRRWSSSSAALIVYEVVRYADFRQNVRQELAREGAAK